jgi:cysteinyl-tRNA synthetase
MLSAHYRSPLNFSDDLVESAKSGLERIITAYERAEEAAHKAAADALTENEQEAVVKIEEYVAKYEAAMEDDLNTADAISVIFELVKFSNTTIGEQSSREYCEKITATMHQLCDILGIQLHQEQGLLDADVEKLIEERQQARRDKNFARADEIRNSLLAMGIALEDTREGVKWKRV